MGSNLDPYLQPGTDTLKNRFGITDGKALDEQERLISRARGTEAARMSFPLTPDGYRALHRHLFGDLYDWAGQDRSVNMGKDGSLFAHAPYVANGLAAVFKDLTAKNGLQNLAREEFFDKLGNHINELNAVHPFREGNGRTMRYHAVQIARQAGHPIRIANIEDRAWMDATRRGFTSGDHRALSAVLAQAAIHREVAPEARMGPGGIALLPPRDPPSEQRYQMSLVKVRSLLTELLPAAREEAADRVRVLSRDRAAPSVIANAQTELAYLRHAKGPVYQSHLLGYVGVRDVEAIITKTQTPLARVRELGAALAVQINMQQPAQLQRAFRSLEHPILPAGQSPSHERLANIFLANTREKNLADPRLAPAQAFVDAAIGTARARGDAPRAIDQLSETMRKDIATRIRAGDSLSGEKLSTSMTPTPKSPEPPTRDKGRSR